MQADPGTHDSQCGGNIGGKWPALKPSLVDSKHGWCWLHRPTVRTVTDNSDHRTMTSQSNLDRPETSTWDQAKRTVTGSELNS